MKRRRVDRRRHSIGRVSLEKRVELRRLYVAEIPSWRHPLVGYVASVPFVTLGLLAVYLEQMLLPNFYFAGAPMFLSVLLVALFWGVIPALFTVFLGALTLDYFYISPRMLSWNGLLQLLPFVIGGVVIAIITAQRESARYRALFAEQLSKEHANELALANQELGQANQMKDQFLSIASHELKTPITNIRGQAQIMLRRLSKERELLAEKTTMRTALQKIEEETDRLNTLVEDLLELSSTNAGKLPLRLGQCDVGEVCREAIKDQQLLTDRTIELEVPAKPVVLRADCGRVSQVVSNLVNNAIKYSPEGCPVKVSVNRQGTVAVIQVKDAGPGIPEDQQKQIFEAFYRAPDAHSSLKDGWGLGLAICKDIVERHGGRIWCDSRPGQGSIFFVELPLS